MKAKKCPKCQKELKRGKDWDKWRTVWACECGFSATYDYVTGYWDGREGALNAYKKELVEYKEWTDHKIEQHGKLTLAWPAADYDRLMSWNTTTTIIEKFLGLTQDELTEINKEVGIRGDK